MLTRVLASLPSVFIGFIVAGVAVILSFSMAYRGQPGGAWHWTMIALVVGLMLVYGAVLWMRSRTQYASEGDGETFYYLGFIYTLATLVATFAPLLNAAERPDIRRVLGLFGLGLSTTFVGLAGRIVFAQTGQGAAGNPELEARKLGDAYAEAARAIERSTVRIVHAQQRAEGHLNESYAGAVEVIRTLSGRVTEQFDTMGAEMLKRFGTVIERISAQTESTFNDLRSRAAHDVETASRQVVTTHEVVKQQIEGLTAGAAGAVRTVSEQVVQDFTRIARESAAELTAFVRQANGSVAATLQEFESRLAGLRLPGEDVGQKLSVMLNELAERAELLRRATSVVGAAYSELEGTLATAVQGARDGGRAFTALAVSADAATAAVSAAKTNVTQFASQMSQIAPLATGLEKFPEEAATVMAALATLRGTLSEANRAWSEVAGVTEGATASIAKAGEAFSTLEQGTRAAEQSVLNWTGGLTKATVGLENLTEIAERAVRLGNDTVAAHAELSAQISGPLAEQLRQHSEAAGALASRLQEDLRSSEEAVRKVHHHLIDASRFILSKVDRR
ncbi:MAG TPA: hypothetical protein VHZ49_20370 [Methylomirabilota bacterium]|jgi:hypothetical protein|nr:hypothetical protein [Methylomirabilota bacterium]